MDYRTVRVILRGAIFSPAEVDLPALDEATPSIGCGLVNFHPES
jgi:hypothetical protein